MTLTLEVVGLKAAQMGGAVRKVFETGGTIGRLRDNDWVLPDEYISGRHAKITFADGAYLIEDTSTNGVFVNSPQNRMTKSQPYALRDGDTIYIDDYEVRVTLGSAAGGYDSYSGGYGAAGAAAPLIPEDPLFDSVVSRGGSDGTDPLALLGIQDAGAVPAGPSAASLASNSPLSDHYRPPAAPPPAPAAAPERDARPAPAPNFAIPDDYDPFAPDEASAPRAPPARPTPAAPMRPAAQPPPSPAPSRPAPGGAPAVASPIPPPRPAAPSRPSPANVAPPTVVTSPIMPPPYEADPPARPAAPLRAPATPPRPPATPRGPSPSPAPAQPRASASTPAGAVPPASPFTPPPQFEPPRQMVPPPQSRDSAEARRTPPLAGGALDFGALLAAAGVDSARVTPELSTQFGQILRVVVSGLMDVLRARERIKDEFRMRMTAFKQQDNNPLKFSANVEDALHNLLVKRNAAFLGPVEAFDDAFADLRNHQMAMLAGMRVAYESMLAEFEPERLQEEFDRQAKAGSFLGGLGKSKYWELYRNKFHDMVKDADSSFRNLFGDEFAKAYEEQLAKLKALNRAERR
jgi:type VI secretion system FHA domain protein